MIAEKSPDVSIHAPVMDAIFQGVQRKASYSVSIHAPVMDAIHRR